MLADNTRTEWADPEVVAADVYRPLMENDRVRVFDVQFTPGQETVMHGHPDHLVYVLADYTLDLTLPDGSRQEVPLKAGQAFWMSAGQHAAKNVGATVGHALVVELKEPQTK